LWQFLDFEKVSARRAILFIRLFDFPNGANGYAVCHATMGAMQNFQDV
jgi:hypothetical protein